ncbi:hypothetical protein EVAR_88590_1 [Eumeta japonica]|uniref:Uncharacterized protein n=1 Tax=Eumeta variegata TaxID=151549 RepID=A0A4C1Y990_EUMVA|nr:hypothetical protein EVAR_88590_1 [Eumeta japonica]
MMMDRVLVHPKRCSREDFLLQWNSSTVNSIDLKLRISAVLRTDGVLVHHRTMQSKRERERERERETERERVKSDCFAITGGARDVALNVYLLGFRPLMTGFFMAAAPIADALSLIGANLV